MMALCETGSARPGGRVAALGLGPVTQSMRTGRAASGAPNHTTAIAIPSSNATAIDVAVASNQVTSLLEGDASRPAAKRTSEKVTETPGRTQDQPSN